MSAVLLIDTSSSMNSPVAKARMRLRIDLLRDALAIVLSEFSDAIVVAFDSQPRTLEGIYQANGIVLPEPSGSTALHLALSYVQPMRPSRLVVISDGQPDDAKAAIEAAKAMAPLTIDAFHVGDETDSVAIAFLRRLSLAGGTGRGRYGIRDLSKPALLANELKLRLTGPKS